MVKAAHVTAAELLHHTGQGIGPLWRHQPVGLTVEHRPGMDPEPTTKGRLHEDGNVIRAVLTIETECRARVAALAEVVTTAGLGSAGASWHGTIFTLDRDEVGAWPSLARAPPE
jgi:hypothetical protein